MAGSINPFMKTLSRDKPPADKKIERSVLVRFLQEIGIEASTASSMVITARQITVEHYAGGREQIQIVDEQKSGDR